jgi:hypothetical protein
MGRAKKKKKGGMTAKSVYRNPKRHPSPTNATPPTIYYHEGKELVGTHVRGGERGPGGDEKIESDAGEEGREREREEDRKETRAVGGERNKWWRWYLTTTTATANMPADRPLNLLRRNGDFRRW